MLLASCGPSDLMGYQPVRKAAQIGVHTKAAARFWVFLTTSLARQSILEVLQTEGKFRYEFSDSQENYQNAKSSCFWLR